MASTFDPLFSPAPQDVIPPPPPRRDPVWGYGDIALILVVVLLAVFFMTAIAVGVLIAMGLYTPVPGANAKELATMPQMIIASTLAQSLAYALTILFMYLLVTRRYKVKFAEALRWKAAANPLAYLFGGAVLSIVVSMGSAFLDVPRDLPIEKMFSTSATAWTMAFFGIMVAPLMEELFFRGFLYPVLNRTAGMAAAVAITAFLFALIHAAQLAMVWSLVMMLFVVGLVFTYARARTGSLLPPYLLHVGYNGTIFVLIFIQTNGFANMEKLARP